MTEAKTPTDNISCFAAALAFLRSSLPRYWEAIIEPPVARAEKILISRMLMESTRETPDTAASPQLETMIVSIMPMVTARNCSTTSGRISRFKSRFVNRFPAFSSTRIPPYLLLSYAILSNCQAKKTIWHYSFINK